MNDVTQVEDRRVVEAANDRYGEQFHDTYDRIFPESSIQDQHVQWLVDQVGPGADVLELGVGTGRVALPLARRLREQRESARYVGLDVSEKMLAALRAKDPNGLVDAGLADIRDVDLAERFDAVLCVCATISMVGGAEAQRAVLANAARCLRPGGTLVVETHHPRVIRRMLGERGSYYVQYGDVTQGLVTFFEIDGHDWSLDHVWIDPGSIRRLNERSRLTDPEELDDLVGPLGLTLAGRAAGLDGSPLDPQSSPMYVNVYRRAA